MVKIMIIEDEPSIVELVKFNLQKAGYNVDYELDGSKGFQRIEREPPDLVILDLMLPGMDGLEICRMIRQRENTANLPVIILTAREDEIDRVVGLEMGADDYIAKPFSPRELVARVKSLLRRAKSFPPQTQDTAPQVIVRGNLSIYPESYKAVLGDEILDLTPKEFLLLKYLAANAGKVFSREHILECVWGYDYSGDSRTVDVHIRHLRQKIEQKSGVEFIDTMRGIGYRFKDMH